MQMAGAKQAELLQNILAQTAPKKPAPPQPMRLDSPVIDPPPNLIIDDVRANQLRQSQMGAHLWELDIQWRPRASTPMAVYRTQSQGNLNMGTHTLCAMVHAHAGSAMGREPESEEEMGEWEDPPIDPSVPCVRSARLAIGPGRQLAQHRRGSGRCDLHRRSVRCRVAGTGFARPGRQSRANEIPLVERERYVQMGVFGPVFLRRLGDGSGRTA